MDSNETIPKSVEINNLPIEILTHIFSYLNADDVVLHVGRTCTHWRDIMLNNNLWRRMVYTPAPSEQDAEVVEFIRNTPQLKRFVFKERRNFDSIINTICENCEDVLSIVFKFKNMSKFDYFEEKVCKYKHSMQCFELYDICVDMCLDRARVDFDFHTAHRLALLSSNIDTAWLKRITLGAKNTVQTLVVATNITSETFSLLCQLKELEYIYLHNLSKMSPPVDISHLTNLRKLQTLQLIHFPDSVNATSRITFQEEMFHHLTRLELVDVGNCLESTINLILPLCPKLRHLNVQNNLLTYDKLKNIDKCSELEYLDVSRNYLLGDDFLQCIRNCKNLKSLDISYCQNVSQLFVLILSNLKKLEALIIEGQCFTHEYFIAIPTLYPKLTEFNVMHFADREFLVTLGAMMPTVRIFSCSRNPEEHHYCHF